MTFHVYVYTVIQILLSTSPHTFSQQNRSPEDDTEEDILEAEQRRRRDTSMPEDPDDIKTYDPDMKTNHYEAKGSYTLEFVGQRRLLRRRRSEGNIDWSNAVENSLLAFINQSELKFSHIICNYFHAELFTVATSYVIRYLLTITSPLYTYSLLV